MRMNKQVVLAARPGAIIKTTDFAFREVEVPALEPGQYLIQNQYLSMDAGFRKWMNEVLMIITFQPWNLTSQFIA